MYLSRYCLQWLEDNQAQVIQELELNIYIHKVVSFKTAGLLNTHNRETTFHLTTD